MIHLQVSLCTYTLAPHTHLYFSRLRSSAEAIALFQACADDILVPDTCPTKKRCGLMLGIMKHPMAQTMFSEFLKIAGAIAVKMALQPEAALAVGAVAIQELAESFWEDYGQDLALDAHDRMRKFVAYVREKKTKSGHSVSSMGEAVYVHTGAVAANPIKDVPSRMHLVWQSVNCFFFNRMGARGRLAMQKLGDYREFQQREEEAKQRMFATDEGKWFLHEKYAFEHHLIDVGGAVGMTVYNGVKTFSGSVTGIIGAIGAVQTLLAARDIYFKSKEAAIAYCNMQLAWELALETSAGWEYQMVHDEQKHRWFPAMAAAKEAFWGGEVDTCADDAAKRKAGCPVDTKTTWKISNLWKSKERILEEAAKKATARLKCPPPAAKPALVRQDGSRNLGTK